MTITPALELERMEKRFGQLHALDGASLTVQPGTLHALLGENGAGKTTLMRAAFGLVRPDRGVMRVHGGVYVPKSPREAMALGIGMVHQHFMLVPTLTVAENVALGGRGRFDPRAAAERVRALGASTGLALDPDALAGELPVSAQQKVEIVKALARDARILVLDEPTAVLAPSEGEELLAWLRRYVGRGNSAVLITHKLREALARADELTVLRHGRTALAATPSSVSETEVVAAMLGASRTPVGRIASSRLPGEPVIRARGLQVRDARGTPRVRDGTLSVAAGEIVGLAGIEGAGQHELLRLLAGRATPSGGELQLPESVGFVPEDRQRDALMADFAVFENVALRGLGARPGFVRWDDVRERAGELMQHFDVRPPDIAAAARTLSGGNQQKLVLARELDGEPEALVVENPTRGLDVRAAADVHERLRMARDRGAAVLVYSGDLDELLLLADRVLVIRDGVVYAVDGGRDEIGRAMLGAGSVDAR